VARWAASTRSIGRDVAVREEFMSRATLPSAPPAADVLLCQDDGVRPLRVLDVAAKVALVALLVAALVFPDLSGIKGKASTARLVVYPLGMLAVPLWWWLYGRRRDRVAAFPWLADLLVTLPWLLDLGGNRANLFDTVPWWDDAMHFLNWLLLTAGVLVAWAPRGVSRGVVVMCGLGFGAGAALLWELGEYVAFVRNSPELATAYTDTLGDLALGSLGAVLAGLVVAYGSSRRGSARAEGGGERVTRIELA
jgi:hypothetical protein